ncbi:MAG TPA: hypothetical protein VI248_05315 [Kineosporiaceae bacterium]
MRTALSNGALVALDAGNLALLPAYLSLLVLDEQVVLTGPDRSRMAAVRRAVTAASGLTFGFFAPVLGYVTATTPSLLVTSAAQ